MKIHEFIRPLEALAPLEYQETYDNAGWITADPEQELTGALITLDVTEQVLEEAVNTGCNLIIAHHPVIFRGIKKLTGGNYVERILIRAIREHIAIYAAHTNLDNVLDGVNRIIGDKLGLVNRKILSPMSGILKKLYTFVPPAEAAQVREALFSAGAGHIGNYRECSFNTEGAGTFLGQEGSSPFLGKSGERYQGAETRIEVVFPGHLEQAVIGALLAHHPYEEPAYDILSLANQAAGYGSGMTGELPASIPEMDFLKMLQKILKTPCIRYTAIRGKPVKKVALCGGSGAFLLQKAIHSGADMFITGDFKYHEFFDADNQLVIADIGHYESEQFTIELLYQVLNGKFPNFAPRKSAINTNPVNYLY
ncbi:MAG TPA: Nif3-like dinuclear metal center hexameric protein [Chitinophagaceae bacterium]|nr:Nif3-like dinuclear metal center hexameric protein [Chitinophagaceae bacterium]